jgi:hypothetical protein
MKNNALFRKLLDYFQRSFGKRCRKICVVCDTPEVGPEEDILRAAAAFKRLIGCTNLGCSDLAGPQFLS